MSRKVFISVGEHSGDLHAGSLVDALRALNPEVDIRAMGGSALRSRGVELIVDSEKSASVMGFTEVVGRLGKISAALNLVKLELKKWRPDVLVIIDFADFNLRLAKFARSIGIPVLYFIPPKVWAWRKGRIRTMQKYVDQVAVIFPFEKDYFEKAGLKRVVYVGHPFLEDFRQAQGEALSRSEFLGSIGLDPDKPLVAVLPGSRRFEVERHLPLVLDALDLIYERHPEIQAVIPMATNSDSEDL
ncbi:MAG: hypothetical protein KDD53_04455, partial [Bdellovibrionales bacterium]|nr:hypothetical protein [Bdellovibrionales bacterium]